MPTIALADDAEMILKVHELMARVPGISGKKIADRITTPERPIRDTHISGLWTVFGGRDAFYHEIARRIAAGEPVTRERKDRKKTELLTEEQLRILADLLWQRYTFAQALAQMYVAGSPDKIHGFVTSKYGTMTNFYAAFPARRTKTSCAK